MPNRFKSRDTESKEITEVNINTGMVNKSKFSDQYVSDNHRCGSNIG